MSDELHQLPVLKNAEKNIIITKGEQRSLHMGVQNVRQHLQQKEKQNNNVQINVGQKTNIIQNVYNITVENAHCFYANGILVWNCNADMISLYVIKQRNLLSRSLDLDNDPTTINSTADSYFA